MAFEIALLSWSAIATGSAPARLLLPGRPIDRSEERADEDRHGKRDDDRAAIAEEQLQVLADHGEKCGAHHQSRRLLPVSVRNTDSSDDRPPPARRRARVQACQRVVGDHLAAIDDDDAVGQALGFLHVVRRVEQRLAAALQLFEVVEDGVAALRVDADRRLVEQQDVGIVQQARGEIQPPLHPAAECLHPVARAIGEADQRQRRRHRARRARRPTDRRARRRTAGCRAPSARRRAPDPAARGRSSASADLCRRTAPARRRAPCPRSGVIRPAIIETVVVFPAPFGPSSPIIWPGTTANDTSSTATSGPKALRRLRTSSMVHLIRASADMCFARPGFDDERPECVRREACRRVHRQHEQPAAARTAPMTTSPRVKPARRLLNVAEEVRTDEAADVADRIDERDARGGADAAEERRRERPERTEHRREAEHGERQRRRATARVPCTTPASANAAPPTSAAERDVPAPLAGAIRMAAGDHHADAPRRRTESRSAGRPRSRCRPMPP